MMRCAAVGSEARDGVKRKSHHLRQRIICLASKSAERSYWIGSWRKPIHDTIPRIKRVAPASSLGRLRPAG